MGREENLGLGFVRSRGEEEEGRDEGDYKHSYRPGGDSGGECVLGALLPRAWHPA